MSLGQIVIGKETSLVTQLLINDFPAFAVGCTQQLQSFYTECLHDAPSFISQRFCDERDAIEEPLNVMHSAILEQESLRFAQEKAILSRQAPEAYQEQLARRLHGVSKLRVEEEITRRFPQGYYGCIHLKVDYKTYTRRWLEVALRMYPCVDKEQERERILSHSDYGLLTNATVASKKDEAERSPYDVYTISALRSLNKAAEELKSKTTHSDQEIKIQLIASFSEAYIASMQLCNGSLHEIKKFITKKGAASGHKRIDSGRYTDSSLTKTKSCEQQKTFLAIFAVFDAMAKLPREAAENFTVDPVQVKMLSAKALGKLQKMVGKFFEEVDAIYKPLKLLCKLLKSTNQQQFGSYIETFENVLPVFERIVLFKRRSE